MIKLSFVKHTPAVSIAELAIYTFQENSKMFLSEEEVKKEWNWELDYAFSPEPFVIVYNFKDGSSLKAEKVPERKKNFLVIVKDIETSIGKLNYFSHKEDAEYFMNFVENQGKLVVEFTDLKYFRGK